MKAIKDDLQGMEDKLSIDFSTGMDKIGSLDCILVVLGVTERLTKWSYFILTQSTHHQQVDTPACSGSHQESLAQAFP